MTIRPRPAAAAGRTPRRRLALFTTIAVLMTALAAPAQQPPQPAPPGDVVGVGNFAHIVADMERSLGFYRDVLGLSVSATIPYAKNEAVEKFGHTEGGQSRVAVLRVPGLAMGIELIEYKDIARKAQSPHFVDPGAANIALRVRNLDALFPKIAAYPGVKILTAGGKPVTLTTPNGTLHAVFVQDPDGFVVEMLDAANAPAGEGPVVAGSSFEATVRDADATARFYNQNFGFAFPLGPAFNDNQQMASTAGAPGASFRQSRTNIPGTAVPFTLIEFKDTQRKELSGRTQDPGTTVLQLQVKDLSSLTRKLKAANVPIVTTGGEPVPLAPGLEILIVRDPNNMLLELIERAPAAATAAAAQTETIRVLSSVGIKAVIDDLTPKFEQATRHTVTPVFDLAGVLKTKIEGGEPFDVAILTAPLIDELIAKGKVTQESRNVVARVGLGLMIKAGARKPDVSSAEAFRKTLLGARSITYVPTGASGIAFIATIEKMGIADALKTRSKLAANGDEVNANIVSGASDIAVLPVSEILPVKGAELGGVFPPAVQSFVVMTAGLPANAKSAAREFVAYLLSAPNTAVVQAKGMER
jgi:molybdate transport system substrate-binding protein